MPQLFVFFLFQHYSTKRLTDRADPYCKVLSTYMIKALKRDIYS